MQSGTRWGQQPRCDVVCVAQCVFISSTFNFMTLSISKNKNFPILTQLLFLIMKMLRKNWQNLLTQESFFERFLTLHFNFVDIWMVIIFIIINKLAYVNNVSFLDSSKYYKYVYILKSYIVYNIHSIIIIYRMFAHMYVLLCSFVVLFQVNLFSKNPKSDQMNILTARTAHLQ